MFRRDRPRPRDPRAPDLKREREQEPNATKTPRARSLGAFTPAKQTIHASLISVSLREMRTGGPRPNVCLSRWETPCLWGRPQQDSLRLTTWNNWQAGWPLPPHPPYPTASFLRPFPSLLTQSPRPGQPANQPYIPFRNKLPRSSTWLGVWGSPRRERGRYVSPLLPTSNLLFLRISVSCNGYFYRL